jgi:DNA-binding HxlR family transcriptional regulator
MDLNCCITFTCPIEAPIQLIGGKYKAIILWHLMSKTLRYSELHRLMPKATDKMLTQQLRELEKDKLISRTVYPVVPPKTEYSLTEFGKSLIPILNALCNWGESYLENNNCTNSNISL